MVHHMNLSKTMLSDTEPLVSVLGHEYMLKHKHQVYICTYYNYYNNYYNLLQEWANTSAFPSFVSRVRSQAVSPENQSGDLELSQFKQESKVYQVS